MQVLTSLNLNNNEVSELVYEEVLTYPVNPTLGMPVFIGGRVMVATSFAPITGEAIWTPVSNDIEGALFTQAAPLTIWDIPHLFDDNSILIQVTGPDGLTINPTITNLSVPGKVLLTFASPVQGQAFLMHRILSQAAPLAVVGGGGGGGDIVDWSTYTGDSDGPDAFDPNSAYSAEGVWNGSTGGDSTDGDIVRLTATRFAYLNDKTLRQPDQDNNRYVRFNEAKVLASVTGLTNDATEFRSTVVLDNWSVMKPVMVVGSAAQTYQELLDALNLQLAPEGIATLTIEGTISIASTNANTVAAAAEMYSSDILNPSENLWASMTGFIDLYMNASGGSLYVYDVNPTTNACSLTSVTAVPSRGLNDDDIVALDANTLFFTSEAEDTSAFHRYSIAKISTDGLTVTYPSEIEIAPAINRNSNLAVVGPNRVVNCAQSKNWDTNVSKIELILLGTNDDIVSELSRLTVIDTTLFPPVGIDPTKQNEQYSIVYSVMVPLDDGKVLVVYWYVHSWDDMDWISVNEPSICAFVASAAGDVLTMLNDSFVMLGTLPDDPSPFVALNGTGGVLVYSSRKNGDLGEAIAFKVAPDNTVTASPPVVLSSREVYYTIGLAQSSPGTFLAIFDGSYYDSAMNEGNGGDVAITMRTVFTIDSNGVPVLEINTDDFTPRKFHKPLAVGLDSHRVAFVSEKSVIPDGDSYYNTVGTVAKILYQP